MNKSHQRMKALFFSQHIISNCVWYSIFGDVIDEGLYIITEMVELRHHCFKFLHFYFLHI